MHSDDGNRLLIQRDLAPCPEDIDRVRCVAVRLDTYKVQACFFVGQHGILVQPGRTPESFTA